jgi:hypothetical protein
MRVRDYDREAAVAYAHRWAYGRNPRFADFSEMGGDCTNFISQCVYAGAKVMNYTPDTGWYYISLQKRAPAWTGVEYFGRFLTQNRGAGPFAVQGGLADLLPGDIVQLSFDGNRFGHSLLVVKTDRSGGPEGVFIATHTYDWDYRPLDSYVYQTLRCLCIKGVRAG